MWAAWHMLTIYLEVDRYPLLTSACQIKKEMNLCSLSFIGNTGSSAMHALHPYCTASPLEVLSDAKR
jgi:hypothetical protein